MKLIKEKHIKSRKEFEQRLYLDNLMEKQFIDMMRYIVSHIWNTGSSNEELMKFIYEEKGIFHYYPDKNSLHIYYYFIDMFTKIFGIDETRAKSFLKRMIIKYYELDVRSTN